MVLRDYQIRTLDTVWEAMQYKLSVLMVAPCSAGKTILFSKLIQRLLRENPSFRALILVDREILVQQSADKLRKVAPELALSIGIVCTSVSANKDTDKPVTVASRQTLINQMHNFPPVQLCICDEAHLLAIPHGDLQQPDQYAKIIAKLREYNPKMRLVGCTASPYRLGSRGGYIYGRLNREDALPYFDAADAEISTRELLASGYIAPLTGLARVDEAMASDLSHVAMVGGEYNLGQLSGLMCRERHVQSCVDAWLEHASERKKTLVFCTSIEHAEAVAAEFNIRGIRACAIHSKLPPLVAAERMQALQAHKDGGARVFTSVAKLTTGLDVVDVDCLILARPTKSTALYKQIVGRGQRLAPGKKDCLVIDLVGAIAEFGSDMDSLRVSIPFSAPGGAAPEKICPGNMPDGTVCGKSVHASLKYCPHCAFEFPPTPDVEAALGELKKVEFNQVAEAVEYEVSSVGYSIHTSRSTGKNLIKVHYGCGYYAQFDEYVCLPDFYNGFAVERAKEWWQARSDEPFPETVEEFMFLSDSLSQPAAISVVKDGRFNRVTDYVFAGTGEVLQGIEMEEDVPF